MIDENKLLSDLELFKNKQRPYPDDSDNIMYFQVKDIIQSQQKCNRWIAVSEKLPKNEPSWISGTTYIITLIKQNNVVKFAKYKEGKWISDFGKVISDRDILAWMPLPEPYKK